MGNIGLLFSFLLFVGTTWLAIMRFRMRPDNSWPLTYYLCLVLFLNTYELVLNPYVVYVSVICALLLRFEFLNERLIFLVRIVEVSCLAFLGWQLMGVVMREL